MLLSKAIIDVFASHAPSSNSAPAANAALNGNSWNRVTIRKGTHELESGVICLDAFAARGRQRAEDHLPTLLDDIREIVDGQRQNEPPLRSKRLYTRLSATEVRRQLSAQKGYTDDHLPTSQTMTTKLNELGYFPKKVATTKPQNSTN
ncbi:hypothetical protein C2W62_40950, partial [Candidatus Entotheonella serta]